MHVENKSSRSIVRSACDQIELAHTNTALKAAYERDGKAWNVENRGLAEYQRLFAPVFPITINEYQSNRSQRNQCTSIMDFMGFGTVLYQARNGGIPFFHGVSFSLTNQLSDSKDKKIVHVRGNVLDERSWQTLDTIGHTLKIHGYGLIFWAAAGGALPDYITDSLDVYQEIVFRLWERTSKQNGTLLAEVPKHITDNYSTEYMRWMQQLFDWQNDHITGGRKLFKLSPSKETKYAEYVMCLEKTPFMSQLPSII